MKKWIGALAGVLVAVGGVAWGVEDMAATAGTFRMSFEEVSLSGEEDMGLLGGTMLVDITDWFAIGPGFYGALSGNRGGFITLGLAGEVNHSLTDRLAINGGLYLGAGGGGGEELSGSGLMLRPYAGLRLKLNEANRIGVGVSYVTFPDGEIDSTQPYIAYEHTFDVLMPSGWNLPAMGRPGSALPSARHEIAAGYRRYIIPDDVNTTGGGRQHDPIGLAGVEWSTYLDDHFFLKIESAGAMEGESNGYMEILGGGGYRFPLGCSTFVKVAAQLGAAGGGGVDAGGGLLIGGDLQLQQYLTEHLFVAAVGGYVDAPDGTFEAAVAALQLGYTYDAPRVKKGMRGPLSVPAEFAPQHFRFRVAHQAYLGDHDSDWRESHQDEDVDNLGLQVDYFATDRVYLTAQGLAASFRGDAGAYMVGLMGAGYHCPIGDTPFYAEVEGLAGAAGGGGLSVGGGLVCQANAGLGYNLSDAVSIMVTGGYVDAPDGEFEATVVGLSIAYRFTTFSK